MYSTLNITYMLYIYTLSDSIYIIHVLDNSTYYHYIVMLSFVLIMTRSCPPVARSDRPHPGGPSCGCARRTALVMPGLMVTGLMCNKWILLMLIFLVNHD